VLPADARDLILAGAIVSIFLNPLLFSMIVRAHRKDEEESAVEAPPVARRMGHVILVGFGRVGKLIALRLSEKDVHFVVLESDAEKAVEAEEAGLTVVRGSALEDKHLLAAGIKDARTLMIAVPEGFEGGAIHEHARHLNANLNVIARAHSDAEVAHLEALGVPHVVMGERELAARMLALSGAS
jgi:CPA2 family monovalent cation:H+ antiporter-2